MTNLASLSRKASESDQRNLFALPAAHALQAWAERLAGPNVAEHLLELRDWRGLQRDALTVWTCPPPVAPARVRAKPSLDAQARRGISASARRHLGNKLMRAG